MYGRWLDPDNDQVVPALVDGMTTHH